MTVKMKKALNFRVLVGIKKTETPIFQGISVVLPKLYLGGRSGGVSALNFCAASFLWLVCIIYVSVIPRAKNVPPELFLNAISNLS